jgi:hypothetical protein
MDNHAYPSNEGIPLPHCVFPVAEARGRIVTVTKGWTVHPGPSGCEQRSFRAAADVRSDTAEEPRRPPASSSRELAGPLSDPEANAWELGDTPRKQPLACRARNTARR